MSFTSEQSSSLISKFFIYKQKYGLTHTVFSYLGRQNPFFWKLVAPVITQSYIHRWQTVTERRILNLGGGSNCLAGCLTVDISPRADAYVDISKQLPFADCSIDAIFCEEVIEHLDISLGCQLLKECWRILKPGGFIRLTTPDLNWFAQRVLISAGTDAGDEINQIFYGHGHCYLYNQDMLDFYCQEAGFIQLRRSTYKDIESKLGYLDSHADRFNHPPEMSQYLEAQKPDR